MSIRKKLTMALLLGSAVPLIIFAIISFYFSENTDINNTMEINLKRTEVVDEKVSALIDKNLSGIKVMSKNDDIRTYDLSKTKKMLIEASKVYPDISSIVVTKSDGNQFARSDNGKLSNISDRDFFKAALKGKEDVVSDVLVSKSNGKLITVLATPIRTSEDGSITGILQGTIELDKLNSFVKQFSTDNYSVYIVDNHGKLLADSVKKMDKPGQRTNLNNFEFIKNGLNGKSGYDKVTKDGKKVLVSYFYDKKTGWIICSEIPYSVAVASSIQGSIVTCFVGIIILIITAIILFIISGYAIKPILELVKVANKVSNGDLTPEKINIKSSDEFGILGKAFEKMIINLSELVNKIKDDSLKIFESSKEMINVCEQQESVSSNTAENANEIATGAGRLNSSIEKIDLSMNNLDKTMNDINKKSRIVTEKVSEAAKYSENGSDALLKVNLSMQNIESSVNDTAAVVNRLEEQSKAIVEITKAIADISEQTNLLALNAAIEAARAGEQGKGFAVVAEEVRKLAEQSGEAAKQVSDIVSGIQSETENVISVMGKGISEVKVGTKVISDANSYFELIFKAIAEISENVKNVEVSIDDMTQNGNEVAENLDTMTKLSENVTEQTEGISAATEEQLASIEQMTASAQYLGQMAENLEKLTNEFKTKKID
ncbi:methyl-accepting chemotaxis protein [Clostridium hydrogenum]|uniref:methyl-accepting chemotaxis protein n=1 Tax=Clostridium hydrogenum TaxID=2855764 RepID=UPI001F3973A3|nr:methyl-accepting chemotaxis protein [Clostridium hydrogenum]